MNIKDRLSRVTQKFIVFASVIALTFLWYGQAAPVALADSYSTFSGVLTNNSGSPVSDVDVTLTNGTIDATSTTDSNGNYSLSLPVGHYQLAVYTTGDGVIIENNLQEFDIEQPTAGIDLTGGDVTQDLRLDLGMVHVTVKDYSGNPMPNVPVSTQLSGNFTTTSSYPGDPGEYVYSTTSADTTKSDANGNVDISAFNGVQYDAGNGTKSICATIYGQAFCLNAPVTINGTTSVILQSTTPPPQFTSPTTAQIKARDVANVTVTTNAPNSTITEFGNLPNGISFHDNGDGTAIFSGQASPVNNGYYFITLRATIPGASATQNFVLSVNNSQTAPAFLNAPTTLNATYGQAFSVTISTTGNPIPNITKLSGSSLPNGVSFHDNNDGTATISGTIKGGAHTGSSNFTLQAKNKNGTVQQQFIINW